MKVAEQRIIEQETIQKIIEIIVKEINPEKIIMFGSRAREDARDNSDYDICVIKEGIEHERNKYTKKLYIALHDVGEAIDLIVETPDRFPKLIEYKSYIYRHIQKDGLIIYEKQSRNYKVA
jgi:predicted nucleotidyltransferase